MQHFFPQGPGDTERMGRFLLTVGCAAAVGLLGYGAVRYAAAWTLPFLLALGAATMAEPGIAWCCRKFHLQRGFVAAVFTLAVAGLVTALAVVLGRRLWQEATGAASFLGEALGVLPQVTEAVFARIDAFCAACPEGVRQWAQQAAAELGQRLGAAAAELGTALGRWVTGLVAATPRALLFVGTTVLALYFTVATYPQLCAFARRTVPARYHATVRRLRHTAFTAFGQWLRAQGILFAVTFGELAAGFWLLGQRYALLLAAVIAVVDALPVLGTGTVLLPWAVVCAALGDFPKGLGLAALYVVVTVVRSILTPKVMAHQADLPPLAALAAMYVGFRAAGVGGMVLLPLMVLFARQFWAEEEENTSQR